VQVGKTAQSEQPAQQRAEFLVAAVYQIIEMQKWGAQAKEKRNRAVPEALSRPVQRQVTE
jgi:hypothetical protein